MSNGSESDDPRDDPQPNPQVPSPAVPIFPIPPQQGISGIGQTPKPKQNEETPASKRELHILERINIFGQLGLVVVGVIAASIYGCQLHTMNRQLTEMQKLTYVSCINAQIARSTLLEVQAGGADSHNLAIGSILQAAAVTRGEAAQIVIKFRNGGQAIHHETGAMGVEWGIENIGQTAANRVRVHLKAVVVERDREPDFRYESNDFADIGTFPPTKPATASDPVMAQPVAVLAGKVPRIFSQPEVLQLRDGSTKRIFFYARVDYLDVFGVEHWSQYCGQSLGTGSMWQIPKCAAYNRTDTNQVIAESVPTPHPTTKDFGDMSCEKTED